MMIKGQGIMTTGCTTFLKGAIPIVQQESTLNQNQSAMPKITEVHLIDITPEKFLDNCTPVELREIDHLIQAPRYQVRMNQTEDDPRPADYPDLNEITDSNLLTCH